MLRRILLVLTALVVALFAYIGMQPSEFGVSRSATIAAPPAAVFPHIADFHKWQAWSPWAKLDPDATTTFEGPASGKGAIFKWSGNDKVGEGGMTIVDSKPGESVGIRLDFVRPFADTADVRLDLKPEGEKTVVTWSMAGQRGFIGKVMCLFNDMDRMVGGDYEKGLANLKRVVEGGG